MVAVAGGARLARTLHTLSPTRIRRSSHRLLRMAGALQRSLPHFVIVGAQKAGTTSLYSYLLQHPQVLPAERKEVHFVDLNWSKGERWYRSHFPTQRELEAAGAGGQAITGEASPYYLFHPHAARRLASIVPDAKIIILLRDPVARALSHYNHNVRKREESLSFSEALDREERLLEPEIRRLANDPGARSLTHQLFSYRARGRYAEQLRAYFDAFPIDQVLILKSEHLFQDPQAVYARVLRFLGLPAWRLAATRAYNVGRYEAVATPLTSELRRYFEPFNRRLESIVNERFDW